MSDPRPNPPIVPAEPAPPDPTEPGAPTPPSRRRPADVWWMVWMTLGILVLTALLVYKEFSHPAGPATPAQVAELPVQIKGESTAVDDITITLCREGGRCAADCKIEILGDKDPVYIPDGKVTLPKTVRGKWAIVRNAQNVVLGTFLIPPAGHAIVTLIA